MVLRDHLHHMEGTDQEKGQQAHALYTLVTEGVGNLTNAKKALLPSSPNTNEQIERATSTLKRLLKASPESKSRLKDLAMNTFTTASTVSEESQENIATTLRLLGCTPEEIQTRKFSGQAVTNSFETIVQEAKKALNKPNLNNNADAKDLLNKITSSQNQKELEDIPRQYRNAALFAKSLAALRSLSQGNNSIAHLCDIIEGKADATQHEYIYLRNLFISDNNGNPKDILAWGYLTSMYMHIKNNYTLPSLPTILQTTAHKFAKRLKTFAPNTPLHKVGEKIEDQVNDLEKTGKKPSPTRARAAAVGAIKNTTTAHPTVAATVTSHVTPPTHRTDTQQAEQKLQNQISQLFPGINPNLPNQDALGKLDLSTITQDLDTYTFQDADYHCENFGRLLSLYYQAATAHNDADAKTHCQQLLAKALKNISQEAVRHLPSELVHSLLETRINTMKIAYPHLLKNWPDDRMLYVSSQSDENKTELSFMQASGDPYVSLCYKFLQTMKL